MAYGTIQQNSSDGRDPEPSENYARPGNGAGETIDAAGPGGSSVAGAGTASDHEAWHTAAWERLKAFYDKNFGLFLVFMAQFLSTVMTTTTRLLETSFDTKFHALQVIFVRMIATATIGSIYLGYNRVEGFPFGNPGVRGLLVLRGLAGTMGLFANYYSLAYLDISDATVITFLVPTLTALICWVALREPYTVSEALASVVAFAGVLCIARPTFIFPGHGPGVDGQASVSEGPTAWAMSHTTGGVVDPTPSTPAERSFAVMWSAFGSFGAAVAYSTIRVIGKRAHSLVSVNYFAVFAMVSSFLLLLILPDIGFQMPQTTVQWLLLVCIGVSGFLLQVLLTEGLQREKAGRATNLIYTQLVFALIFERVIWGTTPPFASFLGGALIIGAAVWVSLQKKAPAAQDKSTTPDEERSLLGQQNEEES